MMTFQNNESLKNGGYALKTPRTHPCYLFLSERKNRKL